MLLFQSIVLISAIAVFLVVMVALVAILLFAKKKLTPQSKVKIAINDKDTLEVDTGNSLMLTLKEHNIHLPSACGGGGSCGMCKCRVVQGGTESCLLKQVSSHARNSRISGVWLVR